MGARGCRWNRHGSDPLRFSSCCLRLLNFDDGRAVCATQKLAARISHRSAASRQDPRNGLADCETKEGMIDRIERELEFAGRLTVEQRSKLLEIAQKCPVHRTSSPKSTFALSSSKGWPSTPSGSTVPSPFRKGILSGVPVSLKRCPPIQQVTCRIAFVSGSAAFNSSMAWAVGRIRNSTLRCRASCFTSSITGRAPVPVPITRRRHFQGIRSSAESGVWPKLSGISWNASFFAYRLPHGQLTHRDRR